MTHPSAQSNIAVRFGPVPVYALHLAPAAIVGLLLLDVITGVPGGILAVIAALIAPGWLLWQVLPSGIIENDPPALPALWFLYSFAALSPAIGIVVFFGWQVAIVEWYLFALLVGLGLAASRVAGPRLEPWRATGIALGLTAVGAVVYRALTWHDSSDDLSYLGFMRRIVEDGAFPRTNPFLSGDVPLAQRWRLDGWTGLNGILSHLGDADPVNIYRDIMPPMLVLLGASALFVLARVLSKDVRFAHFAGLAGLIVPLLTSTQGKTDFKYWYKSVAQNKYTALIAFLPVVAALLIAAYRSRHKSSAGLAAFCLWTMLFVHPLPAVFAVLVFGVYVILDLALHRRSDWRPALLLSLAMLLPLTVTAVGVSFTGEPFGTRLGDVSSLSAIAEPAHEFGPIEIWEPRRLTLNVEEADPEEAAAIFISGHALAAGLPRIAFLPNGMPLAHWRMLQDASNLMVVLAAAVIILGRHRDSVAIWILASALVAVSVFVLPPFAAIVARFVTPWQLWRFSWLIPTPLAVAWLATYWLPRTRWKMTAATALAAFLALAFVGASHELVTRSGPPRSAQRIDVAVSDLAGLEGNVLASGPLRNASSSVYDDLDAVAYRGLATMANSFPSARRAEAFDRIADARSFYLAATTRTERLEILEQHDVDYVLVNANDKDIVDPEDLGLEWLRSVGAKDDLYVRPAAGR